MMIPKLAITKAVVMMPFGEIEVGILIDVDV
jgi:hypothetical protein